MTPKFRAITIFCFHINKDVGIHSFARLLSEAYHSLRWLTSRVIPTYILNISHQVCIEDINSLLAHYGNTYISIHVASYSALPMTNVLIVVISDSQLTKHRVTLLHYVVSPPIAHLYLMALLWY